MAHDSHRELAHTIKNVHQMLRSEAKKVGEEQAWNEHCQRTDVLRTYANAMQKLATEYWEKNADDDQNSRAVSRVKWITNQCENYYFSSGMHEALDKEILLCSRFHLQTEDIIQNKSSLSDVPEILKVLDVGSCYNPFGTVPKFEVVAIDLAPACSEVHQCDFLNLKILEKDSHLNNCNGKITELSAQSFEVVIFSLLLEYLPSSSQRYLCCSKASKLLIPGGILCIVTPDSKHATANAQIIKKWKYALANEGFLRIHYDKLPHLHCMLFRKCINPMLSQHWLVRSLTSDMRKGKPKLDPPQQLMVIPQDFQSHFETNRNQDVVVTREDDVTIASIFADLPHEL